MIVHGTYFECDLWNAKLSSYQISQNKTVQYSYHKKKWSRQKGVVRWNRINYKALHSSILASINVYSVGGKNARCYSALLNYNDIAIYSVVKYRFRTFISENIAISFRLFPPFQDSLILLADFLAPPTRLLHVKLFSLHVRGASLLFGKWRSTQNRFTSSKLRECLENQLILSRTIKRKRMNCRGKNTSRLGLSRDAIKTGSTETWIIPPGKLIPCITSNFQLLSTIRKNAHSAT